MIPTFTIESLWAELGFAPNPGQKEAILHTDGPLLITAGPGSGKTRVLLWRTINLIVFKNIPPEEIFLSTFTEKAAKQLKDGIRNILGYITNKTGTPFDITNMAIGTVHSICQKLISDRRFSNDGTRHSVPQLMDELDQYFHFNRYLWNKIMPQGGFLISEEFNSYNDGHQFINQYAINKDLGSKHLAVTNLIRVFNRFSEECIGDLTTELDDDDQLMKNLYDYYREDLKGDYSSKTDFALLQHEALHLLEKHSHSESIFKYIIIDEYQDTNTIQEKLFFKLANGHKNICVVGDDDQALYRFRGATVENLVDFKNRSLKFLDKEAHRINLQINYRSRRQIVDVYTTFMDQLNWSKSDNTGHYRVMDKGINAFSQDDDVSVAVTDRSQDKIEVYTEIAQTILELKATEKIQDYNQVAVLFPSLKYQGVANTAVKEMKETFEANGLMVYAPRAGRFIEVDEAKAVFGIITKVFNTPDELDIQSRNYINFFRWIRDSRDFATEIIEDDPLLKEFIKTKREEWKEKESDYEILLNFFTKKNISLQDTYDPLMQRELSSLPKLSKKAQKTIGRKSFDDLIRKRYLERKPYNVAYVVNRLTTLDWSVLDLFYQLMGFKYFKNSFDLAEDGTDEGPVCNLSMVSGYLAKFMDQYATLITGSFLFQKRFTNTFFNSFCYALFRLAESEYEDAEDPFPKGRIPFLTIHQSKGLEFPVVILGNLNKKNFGANPLDIKIRDITEQDGEPLDRYSEFDIMRMFYVALSRAKNLLILAEKKRGHVFTPLKFIREVDLPLLRDVNLGSIPAATHEEEDIGKSYSYTGDYLSYLKCPRFYMIFRKYDFAPSRSQSMFFGSLVHRTVEDLHLYLINQREKSNA